LKGKRSFPFKDPFPYRIIFLFPVVANHLKEGNVVSFFKKSSFLKGDVIPCFRKSTLLKGKEAWFLSLKELLVYRLRL